MKKHYLALVGVAWAEIIGCLAKNEPVPAQYRDHALTGNFVGFRDCHVRPDLVLVYRINGDTVELHRLASHSDLF